MSRFRVWLEAVAELREDKAGMELQGGRVPIITILFTVKSKSTFEG